MGADTLERAVAALGALTEALLSKEEAGIAGIEARERLSEVRGGLLALLPIEAVEAVEALIDAADDDKTVFAEVDAGVMVGAGPVTGAPF